MPTKKMFFKKSMRCLFLLLLLVTSGQVYAQTKIDAHLQQNIAQLKASHKRVSAVQRETALLRVFLYFTSSDVAYTDAEIAALGGSVAARFDDMMLVMLPPSAFPILNQDKRVLSMEGDHTISDKLSKAVQHDSVVTWMNHGYTGTSYTPTKIGKLDGSGVLVGVIDGGLHVTSPAFLTEDVADIKPEHLRVKGFWSYENGKCTFYSGQSLIKYECDDREGSHGTHVAAVAAGSPITLSRGGQNFTWSGIAPKADILMSTGDGAGKLSSETSWWNAIIGVKDIFHYADSVKKPCVINISQGCNIGRHDDTHPFAKAMKTLTDNQPGHVVCVASSNEADADCSFQGTLHEADQQVSLKYKKVNRKYEYEVYNMTDTSSIRPELTIWGYNDEKEEVTYATLNAANPTCNLSDTIEAAIYTYCGGSYGNKRMYLIQLTPQIKGLRFTLSLNRVDHDVEVRGYAEDPGYFNAVDSSSIVPSNKESISPLACNNYVLSVGSYTTYDGTYLAYLSKELIPIRTGEEYGHVTTFSSYGYDWNGTYHPDVLCPGVQIESYLNACDTTVYHKSKVLDSDVTIFQDRSILGVMSGTSMAAPHMSGVVALLLQNNPQLTTSNIRAYLQASNKQLPDTTLQSKSGRLDAIALAKQAGIKLQDPTSIISTSVTSSAKPQKYLRKGKLVIIKDGEIYNAVGIRIE